MIGTKKMGKGILNDWRKEQNTKQKNNRKKTKTNKHIETIQTNINKEKNKIIKQQMKNKK